MSPAPGLPASRDVGRTVVFRGLWNIEALAGAFERIGFETRVDPGRAELRALERGSVLACITNIHADVKRPLGALALKRRFNRLGAPLIFWDRDGPSHMGEKAWRMWLLRHLSFMDVYATHSLQDAGRFADEVLYLPNAAWDERYNLRGATLESLRDPAGYRYDVSFFGFVDPQKHPEHALRAAFLERLRPRLEAEKLRYFFGDPNLSVDAQVALIQTSVVNLSVFAGCDVRYRGGYRGEPFSWGLPERCYGIPACGGFLLCDERGHGHDDFVPGAEWVSYADVADCVRKIRYHVEHFDLTRQIAEAAHHRVMAAHRYVHRAEKLVRFCSYWKQKQRLLPVPDRL